MNHWAYVVAAYGLTIVTTTAVALWAFASMRRAERTADALRRDA
ncbi:hypothetical protein [Sphingomonas colocasiae]|nr:hypothetical protein [Sphingomonas colocasiae]